ncbi:FAD:protein FMN transferase [Litoribacillus peritrichatus]|uniref:FAD:protein FMN transferase n=1 Tax=Litoribacillus peritrichatus TaxID=718191 RepID=A0ABP7N7V2_9GAMM
MFFFAAIEAVAFTHTAEDGSEYKTFQSKSMGTLFRMELAVPSGQNGREIFDACLAKLNVLEARWSPWIERSDVWNINQSGTSFVSVDGSTFDLLARARQISELTGGAFDITFASVGYLYDFRKHQRPNTDQLQAHLDAINYTNVQLDVEKMQVQLADSRVKIDLGGIAKGEAIDALLRLLKARGVRSAYFSLGGDSYVLGQKKGYSWMLGIRHPRSEDTPIARIPLEDVAVSTSGDYERFYIDGGERVHHILSPDTGVSADGLMSATVIGPQGWKTDALSTSLFVMGAKRGMALIESLPGYDAIVVDPNGKIFATSGLISSGN